MGGCDRRTGAGLWLSMALLAIAGRGHHRSDFAPDPRHQGQPGFAAVDRDGVESRGHYKDGFAALSLPVSILCRGWKIILPALSALGGYLPGRTVQHRLLRASDPDGGAGDGASAW